MDVVYFGDRRIYRDFETAIRSLREHNPEARIWGIVEDEPGSEDFRSMREADWAEGVAWIRWDAREYFNETNLHTKWGDFGPIRAAFSKILPLDRVVSIDLDTVVLGDVSPLWELDLGGCHVAMVREELLSHGGRPYYNNGICLMDLARIREEGVDDLMIEELNRAWHPYVGQDVMQMFCRILDIGSHWNDCKFTAPCFAPVILHFADRTDWRDLDVVKKYRRTR